jgi:hypothetical protein
MIYVSGGMMGAVIYGDMVPYTMWEQIWSMLAMITCRLFIAMIYA